MAVGNYEKVIVKEFVPENEGELVGWVNVVDVVETDLVAASVAYARISSEGAQYTYLYDGTDSKFSRSDSVQGFEDSTELSVWGKEGELIEMRPSKNPLYDKVRSRNSKEVSHGFADSFFRREENPIDKGVWAVGNEEIIEVIKAQLEEHDAGWMYPAIYYNLTQMALPDMILADPSMAHTTKHVELKNAKENVRIIESMKEEDTEMLNDLTIFGSVGAEEIDKRFIESRRRIHILERDHAIKKAAMMTGRWYLRLSDVRTWPYMDPTIEDEDRGFGRELNALRSKNIVPARYELEKELMAAARREEAAQRVHGQLKQLAAKELQLT